MEWRYITESLIISVDLPFQRIKQASERRKKSPASSSFHYRVILVVVQWLYHMTEFFTTNWIMYHWWNLKSDMFYNTNVFTQKFQVLFISIQYFIIYSFSNKLIKQQESHNHRISIYLWKYLNIYLIVLRNVWWFRRLSSWKKNTDGPKSLSVIIISSVVLVVSRFSSSFHSQFFNFRFSNW